MSRLEKADLSPGLEFDEDVDVARRSEVITKDRSEEGELPDMALLAKLPDLFPWHPCSGFTTHSETTAFDLFIAQNMRPSTIRILPLFEAAAYSAHSIVTPCCYNVNNVPSG